MSGRSVVLLYGPKAVGKTRIARALEARCEIQHVDPDTLVLGWLDSGQQPDPVDGWLASVEKLLDTMSSQAAVSIEATGAWPSDWLLAERLESKGWRVIRVWLTAPISVTLERLAQRTEARVPVATDEARRLYGVAEQASRGRHFDVVADTTMMAESEIVEQVIAVLTK